MMRQSGTGVIIDEARGVFHWECARCGRVYYGKLGPVPIGGWEDPRWRVTYDDRGRPTLEPSLGCRGLTDGTCGGHYHLRDGELVPA